jgi:acetyl esterase
MNLSLLRICCCLLSLHLLAVPVSFAQETETIKPAPKLRKHSRAVIYKTVGQRQLELFVFEPKGLKASDRRPCFLAIHGGGWGGGNSLWTDKFAKYFADRGMVGISLDYRLYSPKSGVSVADCVRDTRSAMRYLRTHASELGIDPEKIVVAGVSAGGHLAAATALFDGVDEAGEDISVSTRPAALFLFSAVLDTSAAGYGFKKTGKQSEELSPVLRVRPGAPATQVYHSKPDSVVPYNGAVLFTEAMQKAGNQCELITYEEGKHCVMEHDPALFKEALAKVDAFLKFHGLAYSPAPGTP